MGTPACEPGKVASAAETLDPPELLVANHNLQEDVDRRESVIEYWYPRWLTIAKALA